MAKIVDYKARFPDWLIIGMNMGMIGLITPEIRLITAGFDEKTKVVKIISHMDRMPTEVDFEDFEELVTILVASNYGNFDDVFFEIRHSPDGLLNNLEILSGVVYCRKE